MISKHLKSLKEPIIYNKRNNAYIIRLTTIGTLSTPYSCRVQNKNNKTKSTYNKTFLMPFGEYSPWFLKSPIYKMYKGDKIKSATENKKTEESLIKSLDKYIKKETALY